MNHNPEGWHMHRPYHNRIELKEVVSVISGYAFPGNEMGSSGSPIIKIKNIIPPMVDTTDVDRISEVFIASIHKLEKFRLKHKDILVAMTGATVGKIGRFPKTNEIFYLNQRVARVDLRNPAQADIDYIYYVLSQAQYTDQIFSLADGSAQANVSASQIGNIIIPLPPLREQRRIAHILGTLDDKIENNRKTAKTLEAMAQAIFQSWFVDFDPVRAKMAGESPESICKRLKLTPEILDLFPDRLVDSELGEIPDGWVVGTLGNVAENPRRGIRPQQINTETPYIALEHMPRRCIYLSEWGTGEELESNKFMFRKNEILFGKLRPYFHKVGVAPVNGVCSTDIVVIAPQSAYWLSFVLGHTSSDAFVVYTDSDSTGTKMPRTSWNRMAHYEIALPPESIAKVFDELVVPTVHQMVANVHESRTLADLRDTLLPKLISGDIRVPEAEHLIENIEG
ncbi:restriction endonuclease subunit S [Acidithiobacillus sp.]|uniref:restriction endonuclease subunit S n=1 Tax=Acidithiobacillus sp. TaxID=1872118 RepID=UPI002587A713|nr:restriction endonuclease subunit S [Acidithiobacillus sp.]MDD5375538.1 restriction endonuclease subunit S [Acidithiobacillus sp.]